MACVSDADCLQAYDVCYSSFTSKETSNSNVKIHLVTQCGCFSYFGNISSKICILETNGYSFIIEVVLLSILISLYTFCSIISIYWVIVMIYRTYSLHYNKQYQPRTSFISAAFNPNTANLNVGSKINSIVGVATSFLAISFAFGLAFFSMLIHIVFSISTPEGAVSLLRVSSNGNKVLVLGNELASTWIVGLFSCLFSSGILSLGWAKIGFAAATFDTPFVTSPVKSMQRGFYETENQDEDYILPRPQIQINNNNNNNVFTRSWRAASIQQRSKEYSDQNSVHNITSSNQGSSPTRSLTGAPVNGMIIFNFRSNSWNIDPHTIFTLFLAALIVVLLTVSLSIANLSGDLSATGFVLSGAVFFFVIILLYCAHLFRNTLKKIISSNENLRLRYESVKIVFERYVFWMVLEYIFLFSVLLGASCVMMNPKQFSYNNFSLEIVLGILFFALFLPSITSLVYLGRFVNTRNKMKPTNKPPVKRQESFIATTEQPILGAIPRRDSLFNGNPDLPSPREEEQAIGSVSSEHEHAKGSQHHHSSSAIDANQIIQIT